MLFHVVFAQCGAWLACLGSPFHVTFLASHQTTLVLSTSGVIFVEVYSAIHLAVS